MNVRLRDVTVRSLMMTSISDIVTMIYVQQRYCQIFTKFHIRAMSNLNYISCSWAHYIALIQGLISQY